MPKQKEYIQVQLDLYSYGWKKIHSYGAESQIVERVETWVRNGVTCLVEVLRDETATVFIEESKMKN
jgi:hypothetical protein